MYTELKTENKMYPYNALNRYKRVNIRDYHKEQFKMYQILSSLYRLIGSI